MTFDNSNFGNENSEGSDSSPLLCS